MTHLVKSILLTAMMTILSSVANGNTHYGKPTVTVAQPLTATQKGRVRVSVPKIQKPKLFTGNPYRIAAFADDRDDDWLDFDDVITSYRREDLQKIHTDPTDKNPEGISEEIRWRLFLARTAAMIRYQQIHG